MGTLIVSSDDKANFDGQGYVRAAEDTDYDTVHKEAGSFVTNYNQYQSVGQRYNPNNLGKYNIHRAAMRFDLTNLAVGSVISIAVMTILAGSGVYHHTDWNFVLVDGSDCTDPLVAADYGDLLDETTSLGSIAVSSITESTTFEITLNAAGRAFLESKAGGVAVIAVRSSDDISGTAPTADYFAGERTEMTFSLIHATDYPYITITSSTTPTVTTDPATSVGATIATLNGTLGDDGGEACDCGFEYGETTDYGTTTATQSKETDDTFEQEIRGLRPGGITYHFRAIATNSGGAGYGADRTFRTSALSAEAHQALGKGYALGRRGP